MADLSTNDSIIGLIRGKLISQHYLTHQLSSRDDWKTLGEDPRAAEIEAIFENVKRQLSKNKPASKGSNEDAVRDQFLNRAFDILGLPWSPSVRHFDKELDYALFPDQETLAKAQSLITDGKELEALRKSCGIVEAERWGKDFVEKPKKSDLSDPIFQIEFYLQNAHRSGGPRWGVLSNGHTWRLYCGDSDPLRHDYLEIELPTKPSLFAQQERDAFKLLVYFFSEEALRNAGRLDKIYDEATRHAAAITAELRRQAFGAVELLASAIMRASPNTAPLLAYEAALIQLFRLLFILKAEADGLLEQRALSDDIADRITKKNGDSIGGGEWEGKSFWHDLNDIFEAIASEYNGHLFEGKPPTSSPAADEAVDYFAPARALLESVTLPNQAVANAIDRLLRVYQSNGQNQFHPVRVDYSTLRVRELGTIYEGLLEWRLEPVSPAALKTGSVKLLGDRHITRKVEAGDYTLVADQSDRKATGSYYTPHYVVEFIGENVLKPLLHEIEEECGNDPASVVARVLEQRILDPAMGSGHFLVFAVEYLADCVYAQLGRIRAQLAPNGKGKKKAERAESPLPLDAPIEFIRARVAERCIYGVDINPLAVELAKLSLWVATAAKGVPLSFLNHHLRCGDSLLGVFSGEFHDDLFEQRLVQRMALAVGHIRLINELYTETLQDVGKKEEKLRAAREHLRRFRLAYDAKIDQAFGHDIDVPFHGWLEHMSDPAPPRLPDWLQGVEKEASHYRFFHWELEFPEVWHDRFGRPLGRTATQKGLLAGFDVVLGNPPFVTGDDQDVREAYRKRFSTAYGDFSLVVPFFELGFRLMRPQGRLGFIVSNSFTKRQFGKRLVEDFLPGKDLHSVVDCSGLSFPGHGTPTCIVFARNSEPVEGSSVCLAAGLKGDLKTPPEDSALWNSLAAHFSQWGYSDSWIAVSERSREQFGVHPWLFNPANEPTKRQLESIHHTKLRKLLDDDVSFDCITAANDIYFLPPHLPRRFQIPAEHLKPLVVGEEVRDYEFRSDWLALWPYDEKCRPAISPEVENYLLPFRPYLEVRSQFHKTQLEAGLHWYEYREYHREGLGLRLAYPQITTHNHFKLSLSPKVFNEKTPLLHLAVLASDLDPYWIVMTAMNSSTVLFWLKQVCFNKGAGIEEEKDRYEFQANKLHSTPISNDLLRDQKLRARARSLSINCSRLGEDLTRLAFKRLFFMPGEAYEGWSRALPGYIAPHPLIAKDFDTLQELLVLRAKAGEERERLRREMIALQEEMDWLVYSAYGLLPQDHPAVGLGAMDAVHPWEVALGQRPFELSAINAGPPADWEEKRRRLWLARMGAIRTNEHIARIEQPVYKRRWVPPDYEKEFAEAFKWWLREKAEFFLEHAVNGGPISLENWAAALWDDPRVRAAAEAYKGSPLASSKEFEPILKEPVEEETVPDDETAFKPRHKTLRGKLNVPRERFRSLTSKPGYYVWAGKQSACLW
jgi:type I restriction-modification system DNA methylase subunit